MKCILNVYKCHLKKCMIKHVDDKHIMNIPEKHPTSGRFLRPVRPRCLVLQQLEALWIWGSIFQHFVVVDCCW